MSEHKLAIIKFEELRKKAPPHHIAKLENMFPLHIIKVVEIPEGDVFSEEYDYIGLDEDNIKTYNFYKSEIRIIG